MERVLTFQQIVDDRFEKGNIKEVLQERADLLLEKLSAIEGVYAFYEPIRKLDFSENIQYRCRFYVRKNTRKVTWNDIYEIINSVKAAVYEYVNYFHSDMWQDATA